MRCVSYNHVNMIHLRQGCRKCFVQRNPGSVYVRASAMETNLGVLERGKKQRLSSPGSTVYKSWGGGIQKARFKSCLNASDNHGQIAEVFLGLDTLQLIALEDMVSLSFPHSLPGSPIPGTKHCHEALAASALGTPPLSR